MKRKEELDCYNDERFLKLKNQYSHTIYSHASGLVFYLMSPYSEFSPENITPNRYIMNFVKRQHMISNYDDSYPIEHHSTTPLSLTDIINRSFLHKPTISYFNYQVLKDSGLL